MVAQVPFWQRKTLAQMSAEEWEQLCDGCGKCCLHKLEDEDSGEVYTTNIACRLLNTETCRCKDYLHRQRRVPDCTVLRVEDIPAFHWLPDTCAYRLLAQGEPLPAWHPLISGDPDSVHRAGISVVGRVVSELAVPDDDYEDHIVHWV
ncbi:YcgN family cysteine cluster protein [Marinimicrobium alkaliphilum]|uniref:YcgN family cysteine cluster protein n=1 Tax=Marinimicrobium alkaliphilum TaxID=2202654 RepID=UPI000DB9EBD7|nr:YcgN family cysteine cluster protein [Marinimicrobium alkaliphilum]